MTGEDERKAIARRAGIVGLGTLASRVLGLGRDVTLAASFSLAQTDAFWIAFTLPNAFRQLLAEGAVTSAVVPVLAKVREEEGEEAAKAFFARIRGLSILSLTVVTLLGVVFAEPLVRLFAGGFAARPGQLERTVALTRWVFPYLFFMGTAALGMAALYTHKRFVVASFAPALLNVAFIGASFGLPAWLAAQGRDPTLALAAAVLVGGLLQALAQVPSLRAIGYASRPRFDFADPRVRLVLQRIAPMALGLGIYYVDLVVCRRLLSGLGEGAQSYFAWAQRLCDFPQGIFVMALSAATLPSLATLEAKGDREELGRTVGFGVGLSLFVAVPVAVVFFTLADPIVVALFQRGRFDAGAAHETARALRLQGLGIVSVAAVRQLVPAFFAMGDTRTPVIVSALDLGALVLLSWLLLPVLGHVGVSAAVAGSSAVQMLLLAFLLRRRLPTIGDGLVRSVLCTALASAAGGAAAWGALRLLRGLLSGGPVERLLPAAGGGLAFLLAFVVVARSVRSPELALMTGAISRRLRRAPSPAGLHYPHGQRAHRDRRTVRRCGDARFHPSGSHRVRGRFRRPFQRGQIQPPQHHVAAEAPGPHELHAWLHPGHQRVRSDLRGRAGHEPGGPAGLRVRQPVQARAGVVGSTPRGFSARAAHAARRGAVGGCPPRRRVGGGSAPRVPGEPEKPLPPAPRRHLGRNQARQGAAVATEGRAGQDGLRGAPHDRIFFRNGGGARCPVAPAAEGRRGDPHGRGRRQDRAPGSRRGDRRRVLGRALRLRPRRGLGRPPRASSVGDARRGAVQASLGSAERC